MRETVPVLCGLAFGAGLGVLRPGIRLPVGAALSVVIEARNRDYRRVQEHLGLPAR
jgi:hypothetical protein